MKIEIHHVVTKEQGGDDSFNNAIALCFDCHCDAGHYFDKHPKGTKFSPNELRKHKDSWIKIVKENKVPFKGKSLIHSRYLITKNTTLIKELLRKDLGNFPIKNSLIFNTPVFDFIRPLIGRAKIRNEVIYNNPRVKEKDYVKKYPDAKSLKKGEDEYTFFHYERIPNKVEIRKVCKRDKLSNFLLNNGIEPERISKVVACYTGACEGNEKFEELFLLRPFFLKLLLITNTNSEPIKLDNLEVLTSNLVLSEVDDFKTKFHESLPNVYIEPNQTIVIPLGCFLSGYEDFEKEIGFSEDQNIPGDYYQYFQHGKIKTTELFNYIGTNYAPKNIQIESGGEIVYHDIHQFNFDNIYWADRSLGYGSCPHIFYVDNNGIAKYQGEIFNTLPGIVSKELITVSSDSEFFIIAELEFEVTYIDHIKLNRQVVHKSIILTKGDILRLKVSQGDIIEIVGKYILNHGIRYEAPILKKYHIVSNFLTSINKNFNYELERI